MSSTSCLNTSCCPTTAPWWYTAGSALSPAAHLAVPLREDVSMCPSDQVEALHTVYGTGVTEYHDGQDHYIFIPKLHMPQGCTPRETDALFCLKTFAPSCGGYTSRLFLKKHVNSPHTPNNYGLCLIAGETWHVYSHNGVKDGPPSLEMVANHLRELLERC